MTEATRSQLLQLNKQFYLTVADAFDATRREAWSGWAKALKIIETNLDVHTPVNLLDLGCGNGRWGTFFLEYSKIIDVTYVGVDENQTLLQRASQSLLSQVKVMHVVQDTIESFLDSTPQSLPGQYDCIVLFGVWHHLPGAEFRADVLSKLGRLLKSNGILIITCWRFMRSERLSCRIADPADLGFKSEELEQGDYILDWQAGQKAFRYCHDTKRSEILPQASAANLHLLSEYSADGKTETLNDYYVFSPRRLLANSAKRL